MKFNYKLARIVLLAILPFIALGAYFYFDKQTQNEKIEEKGDPKVAGAQTFNAEYLGEDLPILPNAEISSLYSSGGQLNVIIETNQEESEINNFYEDYFFKNGWQKVNKNTFQKDNRKMDLMISGNLVKMVVYSAVPTK
jgi:hypothetical protein